MQPTLTSASASTLTLRKSLRLSFVTLAFFFIHSQTRSQEITVTFKIVDSKNEPVPSATFSVHKRTDTLKAEKKITSNGGTVNFQLQKNIQYLVSMSAIGYQPIEKGIVITGNESLFSFTAEPVSKMLSGVEVKSTKPLMRQEDDKTIIEPESLAEASTNGYEVIEKTPGLFVDQDGNIYISSLTPATVQINGRDMKMSAADMATLLKSLPPNAVDKIEIIRTPSAKYDASSSGGIVNVVLKKGVKIGITGSINGGFQQGNYGNQFINFNLNNNTDKKSSSFSLSYNKRNSYERIVTDRLFAPDSVLSQNAFTKYPSNGLFSQYIFTYMPGKWEIEFSGQGSLNLSDNKTTNKNIIEKISTSGIISDNDNFINNKNNSLVIGTG